MTSTASNNYLRRQSSNKYGEPSSYNRYKEEEKYGIYNPREKGDILSKKYNPEYEPALGLSLNYSYMDKYS